MTTRLTITISVADALWLERLLNEVALSDDTAPTNRRPARRLGGYLREELAR